MKFEYELYFFIINIKISLTKVNIINISFK